MNATDSQFPQPLPLEDRLDMARQRVGLGTWEELPESEKEALIERRIWEAPVHAQWVEDREAEESKRVAKKMSKMRGGRRGRGDEEDETETEYIE